MSKNVVRLVSIHRGLIIYTILNYIDKFLNFFTPFLILKFQGVNYTEIEYLISISLIFSSFSDLGLRQYFFYSYRVSDKREATLMRCQETTSTLIVFYTLIGCIGFWFNNYILVIYGIIKGIFQTYINLESSISRLQDNPNKVLWINMTVSIIIIGLFIVLHVSNYTFTPFDYTLAYIIFCIALTVRFFIRPRKNYEYEVPRWSIGEKIKLSLRVLIGSIKFAYPTIVILIINGIETNLSKVYGYDSLTEDSYKYMAVLLRFFSILILAHSSLIGFKSKQIYLAEGGIRQRDILTQVIFVASAYMLMVILIVGSNYFNLLNLDIQFNNIFFIASVTYLCMICRAFLEPYFAKHHKLHLLMVPSIISLTTIGLLFVGLRGQLNQLPILMGIIMVGEILSTSLVLIFYKMKIHRL